MNPLFSKHAVAALFALTLCVPRMAAAAPPPLLPLQGYLVDDTDVALDGTYKLTFTLYDASLAGASQYTTSQPVAVSRGNFTVYLGDQAPLDLKTMQTHDSLWLEIKIVQSCGADTTCNTGTLLNRTLAPRLQLATTAFAASATYCGDAETVAGQAPSAFATASHTHAYASLSGIPAGFPPNAHTHPWSDITGVPAGWSNGVGGALSYAGGNIGIGTTTPANSLHVKRADGNVLAQFETSLSGGSGWIETTIPGRSFLIGARGDENGNFTIYDNTALADRLSISTAGNVGIGTITPGSKLDVNGTITARADAGGTPIFLVGRASDNASQVIAFDNTGATYMGDLQFAGTGDLNIFTGAALTQRIAIKDASGNVGIGTATPQYKLDVAGDINTSGEIRKNGSTYNNPDYVFEPGHALMPLTQLKHFIQQRRHLPNVPSNADIRRDEVKLFEHNRVLQEKLEEAYLYILQMKDDNDELRRRVEVLERK